MRFVTQNSILAFLLIFLLGGLVGAGFFGAQLSAQTIDEMLMIEEAIVSTVNQVSPSVVSIVAEFDGQGLGTGSGFIVTGDGWIITNKHVLGGADGFSILTQEGQEYPVTEIIRDPNQDLAVMKIEATGLDPLPLGDSDRVRLGQTAIAIGNALGSLNNTVSVGVISGTERSVFITEDGNTLSFDNLLQTDAAINPGNSGGPLLNLRGEVVGINTAVARDAENIGFAIPINDAKDLIGR